MDCESMSAPGKQWLACFMRTQLLSFPVQMSYFTFSWVKTGLTNGGLYACDMTCRGRKDSLVCTCARSQG